jgi:hypothetical protein
VTTFLHNEFTAPNIAGTCAVKLSVLPFNAGREQMIGFCRPQFKSGGTENGENSMIPTPALSVTEVGPEVGPIVLTIKIIT